MRLAFRIVSVLVFILGAVAFFHGSRSQEAESSQSKEKVKPARSHVVSYLKYKLSADGTRTVTARRTRMVSAEGEWLETTSDAESSPIVAGLSDGVFIVTPGSQTRSLTSPSASKEEELRYHSARTFKQSPAFQRMDVVAGIKVYVLHTESQSPPLAWIEICQSPLTGRTPLRTVIAFTDGSQLVTEAIKVEFKDVPDFDSVKSMPTDSEPILKRERLQ